MSVSVFTANLFGDYKLDVTAKRIDGSEMTSLEVAAISESEGIRSLVVGAKNDQPQPEITHSLNTSLDQSEKVMRRVGLFLPDDEHDLLRQLSDNTGLSMSVIIRAAIRDISKIDEVALMRKSCELPRTKPGRKGNEERARIVQQICDEDLCD